MKSKKGIKIIIVILLIVIIGLEAFIFLKGNLNKSQQSGETIPNSLTTDKIEKVETKYLADIYSGYNSDNLNYVDVNESAQVYYKVISGLKNKEIGYKPQLQTEEIY